MSDDRHDGRRRRRPGRPCDRLLPGRAGPAVPDRRRCGFDRSAWRGRWDSLVLFTPRRYDSLPGLAFPGDPDGYPTRDEVVAYLERYAARSSSRSSSRAAVRSLNTDDGRFVVELGEPADRGRPGRRRHRPVPGAERAGARRRARAGGLPDAQRRLPRARRCPRGTRARRRRRQHRLPDREGARRDAAVHLAVGSRQTPLPQRLLGRDLFWWLTKLGLITKTVESRLGRRARDRDTLIGSSPRGLKRHGVELKAAGGRRLRPHASASPTAASSTSTP